jgi:hypothetical protein
MLSSGALAAALFASAHAERVRTTNDVNPNTQYKAGVIAANGRGDYGYAVGFADWAKAERVALQNCRQADCKIVLHKPTRCIAMTDSRIGEAYWFYVAYAQTRTDAANFANNFCDKNPQARMECELRFAVCQRD